MRHVNAGTALALVALFAALGGGAYAAIKLPANSVTSRQVKNHSLLARDFKTGQLLRGAQGPRGPEGPQGPVGPAGGVASIARVDGPTVTLCGNGTGDCLQGSSTATCPAGDVVVGGGSKVTSIDVHVLSARAETDDSYTVVAVTRAATDQTVQAQAICAKLAAD